MTCKNNDCLQVCVSHAAGITAAGIIICAMLCSMRSKKPQTISDKAKKAFRTLEETLSI